MSSSRLNLILVPSVLALALPAWAEARQANTKVTQSRPLNLSLPRDVLHAPGTEQIDETVQRNLHAPVPVEVNPPPVQLRYGAGYEQRLQEMHGAGAASGAGGGAGAGAGGAAGAGRRGR